MLRCLPADNADNTDKPPDGEPVAFGPLRVNVRAAVALLRGAGEVTVPGGGRMAVFSTTVDAYWNALFAGWRRCYF